MPREMITTAATGNWDRYEEASADAPAGQRFTQTGTSTLAVGWNAEGRWVQIYVIPKGWRTTADWTSSFDLDRDEIDHLIRTLRRAKRQAFACESGSSLS